MCIRHRLILAAWLCAPPALQADSLYVIPEEASHSRTSLLNTSALNMGRTVWLENCETCHAYGIADAPIPMNPEEWAFRIKKDKDQLYEHAINGFTGPDYSHMPARGGNQNLKDGEVKLAVDYMVFLARYYIDKQESDLKSTK